MADGTGPEIVGVDELYGVMSADPATWPETDDPDEFRAALEAGGVLPKLRSPAPLPTDYALTPMEVTLQGRDIRVHSIHRSSPDSG
jgi:hypothetical protein